MDLDGALLEMEAVAMGARSQRHFYHASINTRADEAMTAQQWKKAADRLEKELGLDDQPRAMVFHFKEGRAHVHVVWSRIDLDTMTAISDSHNFRRHEIVARELEREFGHAHVQGAHVERDGQPRPDRTPSRAEMQQAGRNGVTPEAAASKLTALWQQTDSGMTFATALAEEGWSLARGDRRDFVVVDPLGGVHSMSRRIDGAQAKDIRTRLADLNPSSLPSVETAREGQIVRQQMLAREVMALDVQAPVTQRPSAGEQIITGLPLCEVADPSGRGRAPLGQERAERSFKDRHLVWEPPAVTQNLDDKKPVEKALRVLDGATGVASKLGDFMVDLLAGSTAPAPGRANNMGAFVSDPAARKEQQLARLEGIRQAKAAERALKEIDEDMKAGRALKAADIQNLTRAQQESIRNFGDDAVRQMVEDARKRDERHWKGEGRERD